MITHGHDADFLIRRVTQVHSEAVEDGKKVLDGLWERARSAHEAGDQRAMAHAYTTLGRALADEGRLSEAASLLRDAAQAANESGDDRALLEVANAMVAIGPALEVGLGKVDAYIFGQAIGYFRGSAAAAVDYLPQPTDPHEADAAYEFAAAVFEHLGQAARERGQAVRRQIQEEREAVLAAEAEERELERQGHHVDYLRVPTWEEIAIGYVAIKVLGPFLESFAKMLGEQLGESTAEAVRRLHLIPARDMFRRMLGIKVPGKPTMTMLELPDELTDEVKEAIIDLDLKADGVRGERLYWDPESGKFGPFKIRRK